MSTTDPRTLAPGDAASWRRRRLDPVQPRGLRLTLAVAAAFLVLVPFTSLALLVLGAWPPLRRMDTSVTEALHGYALEHPGWVRLTSVWTEVFAPMPLRVAALAVVVWLVRRDARRLALWVAVTMLAGGLLGALLKLLVARDRPELLDPVARAVGYAFPSGHAVNAALAAGVLLVVFLPLARRRAQRAALWATALLLTVLTGASRVALGVHWTSDVIGGWLLATAVLAGTAAGFAVWQHAPANRH
ncbi:phosphatase PAP2 family protein [Micromonospora avicenniae]|uniref:Undecaprenyl-diphosphatase n=1 Tax=Micromonospora avicenniae TaxID=1198245 RepID=A0A1N6R594_9ACTN|nr:phosphatase PAP2 family protein [Micromonospora avicenniae]SIQ23796.1 undecaprenyl-diphosphatase [Micromonospora avicenniae]